MSKVDAQRAMREAKYLARQKAGVATRDAAPTPTTPPTSRTKAASPRAPKAPAAAATEGALCGHKSMNGRTCTRPSGHSEKNHRYG